MIEIRRIGEKHKGDSRIPNQPFALWGRMIPSYQNGVWRYTVERLDPSEQAEMCFPDENYDYAEMCKASAFLGAYDTDTCIGLAVLQEAFFRYMYLYDLKVNRAYRNRGVASLLIENAKKIASEKGYRGIYTQGQDNNLSACLFYIKCGFRIGGLDTEIYKGTRQEGKADILFYLDVE